MAKESVKARERKREAAVAKYAVKRAALKAAGDYVGLDKLPKNASPVRLHNRCKFVDICVSSVLAVLRSVRWHPTV